MKRCAHCGVPLEGRTSVWLGRILRVRKSSSHPDLCNRCEPGRKKGTYTCHLCQRKIQESIALTHVKAEEYLLGLIKKDHPEWGAGIQADEKCLSYYRDLIVKACL
jgi:hypothetical protein